MTQQTNAPGGVPLSSVSRIECDLVAGSMRYVARLSGAVTPAGVTAIWLNETGPADLTEQAVQR